MADNINNKDITDFKVQRVSKIQEMYVDEVGARNRLNAAHSYAASTMSSAAAVRDALKKAISDRTSLVETSKQLYATNPIYASVINYFSNNFR